MLSAICFSLDESKILSSGKGVLLKALKNKFTYGIKLKRNIKKISHPTKDAIFSDVCVMLLSCKKGGMMPGIPS